jgi:hypothetical protein
VPAMQCDAHNMIEHEIIFSRHDGYVFHDSCGFQSGSESELNIVKEFLHGRLERRRLRDRLHAIWFVPLAILFNRKVTKDCFSGIAFRWIAIGHR